MRTRVVIHLLTYLLLFLPAVSHGGQTHKFRLDYRDGLCSTYIRGIGQDGYGYVWVATGDGLNRFDGRRFRSYTKEDSGLSSNELNCVLGDPTDKNVVWISTRHDGLCRFDHRTGRITPFEKRLSTTDIPWLSVNSENRIWVTNYHSVPDLLDPAKGTVTPLYRTRPENFPRPVWCAVEDNNGEYLYVGHEQAGMTVVNLRTKKFTTFRGERNNPRNMPSGSVYAIHIDKEGLVWLGTDDGIRIYNPRTGLFTAILPSTAPGALLPGDIRCICEASNGDLLFGTMNGGVSILRADNRIKNNFSFDNITSDGSMNDDENISSPYVWSMFEDSYGNIWIGNYNDGVDVVSYRKPFFIEKVPFGRKSSRNKGQAVWSAFVDKDNTVFVGGVNEIMEYGAAAPRAIRIPTYGTKYNAQVRALLKDSQGRLWIGTNNSGVYIYTLERKSFAQLSLPVKEIKAFAQDKDGTIWIGTFQGVYKTKDGRSAEPCRSINSSLLDTYITSLLFDEHGSLWVGTFGKGLSVFRPDGARIMWLNNENGLPSNTVNAIRDDGNGFMWLATRGGAVRVPVSRKGGLLAVTHRNGLPSSDIRSIEADRQGNVWLAANSYIARYNQATGQLSVYNRTYSTELISFTENASCIDRQGRVLFGQLNGMISFNPSRLERERKPGSVILTGLRVNTSSETDHSCEIEIPITSEEIELPYDYNTFTLKFNSLDITQAANSDISYNMEGVNEVWTNADATNEAIYRNLPTGHYTFQVRCRLHGDDWSKPITLAQITITPPIYLAWWAKLFYVTAIVLTIWLLFGFYKHKLILEKNLEIERETSKNNRLLNEERLIFFTNITHELRTPLSLIIGPIEDLVNDTTLKDVHRAKLYTIRNSSMRLLNLINGILEFRKTETQNRQLEVVHGSLANFVREVGIRFKELNNKDVSIVINVDEMEGIEVYYDSEMINTIINNLMSNALKYTKHGTITLSLHKTSVGGVRYIDLKVADTGVGIAKKSLPYVFKRYYQADNSKKTSGTGIGLALTKNLVDLHEGTISVESEEGKGSVFTVRLVMDNSYPNAKHREITETSAEEISDNVKALGSADGGKLKLLIVEDDEDVCTYVAQSCSEEFDVLTASNGVEGLEIARQKMPDIIVSDIMMPEMDGIELCHTLKNDIMTSHIPIVLLTAKDSLLDREKGYLSGADSYITKPFSTNLLKSRINNLVENRHKFTLRMLGLMSGSDEEEDNENPTIRQKMESGNAGEPSQLSTLDKDFITRFRRLVEENMKMEDLDQSFLADKLCMSLSTLYRKVKSISGLTPNEFIRRIKLRRAAELVMDDRMGIAEIAARTGFGSAAYFRRVFKKEFGVSPTEYTMRNKSQKEDKQSNETT